MDNERLGYESLFAHSEAVRATSKEVVASARAAIAYARRTMERSQRLLHRRDDEECEAAIGAEPRSEITDRLQPPLS
jgi:hypothetical protein